METPRPAAPASNQPRSQNEPPRYLLADGPADAAIAERTEAARVGAPEKEQGSEGAAADGSGGGNGREGAGATPRPPVLALVEAGIGEESPANLPLVLEALLLATEEPPTISRLAQATNVAPDAIEEALDTLEQQSAGRGIRLQRSGSTVALVTAPEAVTYIERLLGLERPNRLSKAALETLAIIAYRQPVTRSAIEAIRGVSCDASLGTLRLRELIRPLGQADGPGRPNLWATTPRFLAHFGLGALTELPPLPAAPAPAEQGALALQGNRDGAATPGLRPDGGRDDGESARDAPEPSEAAGSEQAGAEEAAYGWTGAAVASGD
ncbi:MAG: SMC-Scp complex subunit ScpB [Dehalococcoidia bacterium]